MTRQRLDADARRKQFEEATILLVSEMGYRAVTTDAVVQHAGVSKGLLWRYYTNLDELMTRAAARALRDLEKAVAESVDLTLPVTELLQATIHQAAGLPKSHRTELVAIQRIATNIQSPDGSPILHEGSGYEKLYANQTAIMIRGQREGSIKSTLDPLLLARIYQGAVDSMIDQLMHDSTLDPKLHADSLIAVLLHGITA